MPFIDRGVILHAGICTDPGSPGNTIPEVPGFQGFANRMPSVRRVKDQSPSCFHGLKEAIRNANAIVGVLPGYRLIGFAVPIRVVFMKNKMSDILLWRTQNIR